MRCPPLSPAVANGLSGGPLRRPGSAACRPAPGRRRPPAAAPRHPPPAICSGCSGKMHGAGQPGPHRQRPGRAPGP